MSSIINRNFFRLLRNGAFSTQEKLEPMAAFKWQRLSQIAEMQNVEPFIEQGLYNLSSDPARPALSNFPPITSSAVPTIDDYVREIEEEEPELSNILLKWQMKRIHRREENNPESTPETWQLMLIIVNNVNQTLTKGISLRGIIELGRFLRTKGQLVDFVQIENWLQRLYIMRMTSLQGSILVNLFNFADDEIPFMHQQEKAAVRLVERSLTHTAADTAENWHFRMRTNGMVQNNSKVLRRNLRRSFKYLRYNPIETTSNFMANFAKTLAEIEE